MQEANITLARSTGTDSVLFTHKNTSIINDKLNSDFNSLCEWLVDNKLSIHLGGDKTKSIMFTSRNKIIKIGTLAIHHEDQATFKSNLFGMYPG